MRFNLILAALTLISATAVAGVPDNANPNAQQAMTAWPLQVPLAALQAAHPALTRYSLRVGEVVIDRTAFQAPRATLENLQQIRRPAAGGRVTVEVFPGEEFDLRR